MDALSINYQNIEYLHFKTLKQTVVYTSLMSLIFEHNITNAYMQILNTNTKEIFEKNQITIEI